MKKIAMCFLALFVLCVPFAFAEDFTIESSPGSLNLGGDSAFDDRPGTPLNPWIIRDGSGRQIGTIQSQSVDMFPGDGWTEPGTSMNPYEVDID